MDLPPAGSCLTRPEKSNRLIPPMRHSFGLAPVAGHTVIFRDLSWPDTIQNTVPLYVSICVDCRRSNAPRTRCIRRVLTTSGSIFLKIGRNAVSGRNRKSRAPPPVCETFDTASILSRSPSVKIWNTTRTTCMSLLATSSRPTQGNLDASRKLGTQVWDCPQLFGFPKPSKRVAAITRLLAPPCADQQIRCHSRLA